MKHQKNIGQLIFIILFLVMLIAPNMVMLFHLETTENNENRAFNSLPDFNLKHPKAFLTQFKNYYPENFGLKTTLVNNYIDFKFEVLNETPLPNKVVKGLNDWYFLGNSYNNTLDNAFGNNPFSASELKDISNRILEIKNYLAEKNIAFYVVVPPNKNSIYKAYLPFKLKQQESKLDGLKTYLKTAIEFEIIDLTDTLLAEKDENLVYLKTDSHWNDYGAFIGYQETLKRLNQDFTIPTVALTDYHLEVKPVAQGDIIKMINLDIEESALTLTKKTPTKARLKTRNVENYNVIHTDNHLNLFMYYDSFSYIWMPYFNESFGNIHYLKTYSISKKQLEQEKPDMVIFEIVERNIDLLLGEKSFLVN